MSEIHLGTSGDPPGEPAPPRPPRTRQRLLGLLIGIVLWPTIFVALTSAPACMGFEGATIQAIESCPRATEILGTPVTRSWIGMSCGNAETADDTGDASWTFPVSGPRGSGSIDVYATRRGGPWIVHRATLEAEGTTIDVTSCTEGGPIAITEQRHTATVTQVIGSPGVEQGGRCTIAITPSSGGPYNCRIQIDCGATNLYGSRSSNGYASCGSGAGGGLVARDDTPTPQGGDPTLDLRLGDGEVILTDQTGAGTWVVEMHVDR